ncbi:MAG: universal stress protein [Ilumatobacteraceae bacterium]
MSKRVTVGFDGSNPSLDAVWWAADEAVARGAHLRIVSCYQISLAGITAIGWAATEAYAALMVATENGLVEIRDAVVGKYPGLEITAEPFAGQAGMVLVDNVDADDLVVVGASRHEGVTAFWLGSTSRHVVRHSPCPVVVVRGGVNQRHPDRIVVGVDGSPASDSALEWAGDEADRRQVDLVVVHGWSYPYLSVDEASSAARDLTKVDAACVLDRAVESARERFSAEVTGELVEQSAVTALLDTARGGDLLVLGSRGRGAIVAGLFGSTVSSVLDRCSMPVAVVRGVDDRHVAASTKRR